MEQSELEDLVEAGTSALGLGEPLKALVLFERAAEIQITPTIRSSLAYCLARERGQIRAGRRICEEMVASDPDNLFHYLNLGRILLLEENRRGAIEAFRAGIEIAPHPHIIQELKKLGVRKPQVIGFLHRENIMNKYLGLLRDQFAGGKLDKGKNRAENS